MSDSAKYPGLCKQQYNDNVNVNAGSEYVDLEFNSINTQRKNSASHFTYKTYNSEYDNKRMLGSSSSTSNTVPFYVNQHQRTPSYNSINNNNIKIGNNELHSFVKRQQQSPYHQQQYDNNQASSSSFPSSVATAAALGNHQQTNIQQQSQLTPFLQAYNQYLQQSTERRPIDRNNPFQTYRWDQLFKNYV